ncbi:hypothetical protein Q1695_005103 [Nippostrongylus brasiliensis]|nr:hypothetical protein Q1695_005100 [Nippostrongylus brasiliensis]WKY03876.1 hypothetical protein Q1695_005103 [Nippostrongylus brasiliensis]
MSCNDATPAQYPKNYSYRHIVNSLLENGNQQKHQQFSQTSSGTTDMSTTSSGSILGAEVSPSFTLNPGDVKMVHHLRSGGKLVIQKKKNGDVAYALNCPDGRKVFLEKTKENAVLSLTDSEGHSIKTLACEF